MFVVGLLFGCYKIESVSRPKIQYAEFPFVLKYEINGELKVVEDTIICRYNGEKCVDTSGTYHDWSMNFMSGNNKVTLFQEKNENGKVVREFYFYVGNAEYYMDDEYDYKQRGPQTLDHVAYTVYDEIGNVMYSSSLSAEEAFKQFKIKLIDFNGSPPISNDFEQITVKKLLP